MNEKQFSFFCRPAEKENKKRYTFGALPFARQKTTLRKSEEQNISLLTKY
jgi:hypothetical protein